MMQKISVLYILVGEGGSDQALLASLKGLRDEVEPYVLLGRLASSTTLKMLQEAQIPYEVWRYKFFWLESHQPGWKRLLQTLKLWQERRFWQRKVMRLVQQRGIQLIHTNTSAYQFGLLAAQALHIPHVWYFREYQTLDFNKQHAFSLQSVRRLASLVGNYNLAVTQGIYRFYQLPAGQSTVLYDGILEVPAQQVRVLRPYFLYVGRVVEEKGVRCLLQAYGWYVRQGGTYDLLLIGEASTEMGQYVEECKQQLTGGRLQLLGKLPTSAVYGYMQQAVALVVPSPFEAFGLITAEAMFNHCLVIGRNVAGTREQMDNGLALTGEEIAIRFDTEAGLAEELKRVALLDAASLAMLKERAYRTVTSFYSVSKNAACLRTLYYQLLSVHL